MDSGHPHSQQGCQLCIFFLKDATYDTSVLVHLSNIMSELTTHAACTINDAFKKLYLFHTSFALHLLLGIDDSHYGRSCQRD